MSIRNIASILDKTAPSASPQIEAASGEAASQSNTLNYSTLSITELEELAAQGDVQAQSELNKRKATENSESQPAGEEIGGVLNIEV